MIECLKADQTARWCPWEGCNHVMTGITSEEKHLITCTSCNRFFCGGCSQKWHSLTTCEDVLRAVATIEDPKYVDTFS